MLRATGIEADEQLRVVDPAQRVLLLPHCLRRVETCKGKYSKHGLLCQSCTPECAINQLRKAALDYGYKGVCVAPGGQLALRFIKEIKPLAIVAVACDKELEEGVRGVREEAQTGQSIAIVIVPLIKDGCVDTEVDMRLALDKIALGCEHTAKTG